MVISNLNTKLIEDRLGFINQAIVKLRKLSYLDAKDFLDGDNPAIAESYLRRALEAIFDIARHIIAKTARKGLVEYKEVASALGEQGVISQGQAEKLRLMAGYRNRLIHFYHEIGDRELYLILTNNLSDIEDYVREIKAYLEAYRQSR